MFDMIFQVVYTGDFYVINKNLMYKFIYILKFYCFDQYG